MKDALSKPHIYGSRIKVLKRIRKVTIYACDTEDVEFVKKLQNLLMPLSEEFGSKKHCLEPLIDVHLHRLVISTEIFIHCNS